MPLLYHRCEECMRLHHCDIMTSALARFDAQQGLLPAGSTPRVHSFRHSEEWAARLEDGGTMLLLVRGILNVKLVLVTRLLALMLAGGQHLTPGSTTALSQVVCTHLDHVIRS
jgi:hypothetical protein